MIPITIIKGKSPNLTGIEPEIIKTVAVLLYKEQEDVMGKSKRLVPVATGALRSSGTVHPPRMTGRGVAVEAGYGGAAVPYAARVHDDLTMRHTNGIAKFLEIPFAAAQDQMESRIQSVVDAVIAKRMKG